MANMDIRVIGLELQANIAALKALVDEAKTDVDAINTAAAAWVLNDEDASLPTASAVKTQLTAYNALAVTFNKPALSLADSVSIINAAA